MWLILVLKNVEYSRLDFHNTVTEALQSCYTQFTTFTWMLHVTNESMFYNVVVQNVGAFLLQKRLEKFAYKWLSYLKIYNSINVCHNYDITQR